MRMGLARFLLGVVIGAMLAVSLVDLFLGHHVAAYDADITAVIGQRDTFTVRRVQDSTSGLRVGERVTLLGAQPGARLGAQMPGAPLRVRGDDGSVVTLHPHNATPSLLGHLWDLTRVLVLVLALAILFLRGTTAAGFALAVFLSLTAFFSVSVSDPQIGSWFRTAYVAAQGPLGEIQTLALLVLIDALGSSSPLRRRILRIGIWLCLAAALYQAVGVALLGATGLLLPFIDSVTTGGVIDIALLFYAIFSLIVSLLTTRGADRRQLAIVGCALVIGEFTTFYNVLTTGSFGIYGTAEQIIGEASLAIMAIGLAYAILVERLFDIGFVINRAVVYAVISTIVVTVFAAVEWAVERWAGEIGHVRGQIIEMLVAVAIGLSLRPLHAWVDRFVDAVLFAQRHRAANELARFAREAHLVGEPRKLFEATRWTLRTFARASDCDILLREDDRTFRSVFESARRFHEDDVLVLRLRAAAEPVLRTAFPGLRDADVAFPMVVRGTLTGIVLVSLPPRAEPYSPEEVHALERVGREVAFALVALDAAEAKRLREENAELRARLLIS
ncbi:MAG: hypothetical protein JWN27_1693 [Candidatus Eremiobacteraeota bacterium]|nr:hypothetical protein [Candidatus Eremiobacteraeota bacterium]